MRTDLKRDLSGPANHSSRTKHPPRYFFIDFGVSRHYRADELPVLEPIVKGGDKSAPEHKDLDARCDPFPTDVYYLGNVIRQDFIDVCHPTVSNLTWRS
jgi:hypothetical protein